MDCFIQYHCHRHNNNNNSSSSSKPTDIIIMSCINRLEQFQQNVRLYPAKPYIDPTLEPMIPLVPSNIQSAIAASSNASSKKKKSGLFKRKSKKKDKEGSSVTDPSTNSNNIAALPFDLQDPFQMKEFFSIAPALRSKIKKLSKLMDEYDQVYYQVLTAIDDKETNSKSLSLFLSFFFFPFSSFLFILFLELEILMENVLSVINRNSTEIKSGLDKIKSVNDQISKIPDSQSTGDYRIRELQVSFSFLIINLSFSLFLFFFY